MTFLVISCVLLFFTCPLCLGRYTTSPEYGSGDGDALISPTQNHELVLTTTEISAKDLNGTTTPFDVLESVTQFLKEYMILVIVVGSLVILLIFIVCAAVIMSHRHKASAYYPSSFSQKEYVNHDDKCGGARVFNEIPEKVQDSSPEEVVDSSKQLQADILSAAQNLKSPTKGASAKEVPKIPEEPKETSELMEKGKTNEATTDKPEETAKTQQQTPTEKVEEAPSKPPEVSTPVAEPQEPTVEVAQVKEEEVGGKEEEANPVPSNCGEANNNPCDGQESQQTSEPCGV